MAKTAVTTNSHRTDEWFKTLSKVPEWLENVYLGTDEVRVLQIPSLSAWHKFMRNAGEGQRSAGKYGSWSGTTTWNEYIELLDKGDERVVNQIKTETKKAVNRLEHTYEKVIDGYKYDVAGEFFDIGLVMSGVPETWLEPDYKEKEKPQITIRINMSFNGRTNTNDVIANGAKLLGMAKVLEDMNVNVAIELYTFSNGWSRESNEALVYQFPVKGYDEPINYNKLSSLLTTATLRRGGFRLKEVLSNDRVGSGYGTPLSAGGFSKIADSSAIARLERELFKGFENGKVR